MSRFYLILGVVAVIGVGVVGYSVGTAGGSGPATTPVEVPGLDDPQQLVEMAQGMVRGDEDAPISIVEFADYQCPGCGAFATMVMPQVVSTFVETGEAKVVFYDFPLTSTHPNAFIAARAARCAGDQDRYWELSEALFGKQAEWSYEGDPTGRFVEYAGEVGLDTDEFRGCLRSDRHADVVTANMRLGEELGIRATPTVMVSRGQGDVRRLNRNNFQAISEAVRALQQGAGEATGGG